MDVVNSFSIGSLFQSACGSLCPIATKAFRILEILDSNEELSFGVFLNDYALLKFFSTMEKYPGIFSNLNRFSINSKF